MILQKNRRSHMNHPVKYLLSFYFGKLFIERYLIALHELGGNPLDVGIFVADVVYYKVYFTLLHVVFS